MKQQIALGVIALISFSCTNAERDDAAPARSADSAAISAPAATAARSADDCPRTGLWAVCSIEKRLRQSGFVAQKVADSLRPSARAGFSPTPRVYMLNKSRLEIYLYRDAAAAARDLSRMDTVKVVPLGGPASSGPAPVFIHSANLVALLYTDDATQAERLTLAVTAGPPQPG